jgi:S-adenosylmethionine-diacylglycerol 3-amino-3-carboxypropyl transferase
LFAVVSNNSVPREARMEKALKIAEGPTKNNKGRGLRTAVHRHDPLTKKGLLERAFTFGFRGLVYPQIWEDPAVDLEALQITPAVHLVTIASGGCNVLNYLAANPMRITAVDLNDAHIALSRLKLCAARHLPDRVSFYRFFGEANWPDNVAAYNQFIRPHLDATSRRYWESRTLLGRRRISGFARNFYRRGLLGNFIGAAHLLAKLYGINPREILAASSISEQRTIFDNQLAPIFEKRFVRWLVNQPASLFGLGIPPAQYEALCCANGKGMASVLKTRLEHLACDFDLKDNYFAWQAFSRGYGGSADAPLPLYLQRQHYDAIVAGVDRVDLRHANLTEFLAESAAASLDRYVLLDAQDWMTDAQLGDLWRGITRTARPGARTIFRTAARESLLPGRIPDEILACWRYEAEYSSELSRRDRSSIYGGFHLYVHKDAAT